MGFMSHRQKNVEIRPEQKWDYISLNDFKSTSCFTPFAYGYLWFSLGLSVAVYAVDIFTAVNLLAFNKWSSEIAPTQLISFDISKWIFSICIILSTINLIYEHIRAQRIMKRGSVAECYLDNLAVRLESIRMGGGKGWKRFLVFAELTKSKKGAEYVALFTYFSFQSWIRVILCSGPRQVVNALTLLSVYNAKLSATGDNVENTLLNFFGKIRALALEDYQQALILSGMLFTLVVWVFSFLSLLLAFVFFIFFLCCYIPREDGGLSGFCSRKINKRLMKIVMVKVNTAMAEEERRRKKAEWKAAKKAGELPPQELKATIPDVGGDDLPPMPMLNRNDTMATLPPYSSRPGSPGSFELGSLDQKRPTMPGRSGTMVSTTSNFSTKAPLLDHAADLGYNRSASPAPSIPTLPDLNFPLARTGTSSSNRSFGGAPPQPLRRTNTDNSTFGASGYSAGPAPYSSSETMMPAMPQPVRSPVSASGYGSGGYGRQQQQPSMASRGPYDDYDYPSNGRASPAPSVGSYRGNQMSPRGLTSPNGPGYPMRSATNPVPPRGPPGGQYPPPQRNMTAPVPRQPRQQQPPSLGEVYDFYDRPPTESSQRGTNRPGFGSGWGADVEAQRGPGPRY